MDEKKIGLAAGVVNAWLRRVTCDADGRDQMNDAFVTLVNAIRDGLEAHTECSRLREENATLRAACSPPPAQGN